jgi:ABC-type multidrug transport system ATPase subunit
MNLLDIKGLCKTYPNGVAALAGIDLELSNGMFGLLGPNGAGKSTLMRTLATLQSPNEGTIHFNGTDILAKPNAIRKVLGYLPQEFGVYPKVSAQRLLDHLALLKGVIDQHERREQVASLLEQTNLYAERKRAVHTFSGGMRQRFGIAQALLGQPRLVIVDEPTAGLDPQERYRFLNLLSEIGEDIIVILSTHLVEDVRELCPRMAIMADGAIIAQGNPQDLCAALEGKIWQKTIAKSSLSNYQQQLDVISTRLLAGQTVVQVLADTRPEEGFSLVPPDLESVYFTALGR